ncbi:MauE/DoxX family redox-associated membrane protein [Sphingobacterium faecium]|uniref:MauE/DoxX family redox-associated membrane protein n=1 Tax=Sphingobacterium faecium TaxID=34087 RepID=UPI003209978C
MEHSINNKGNKVHPATSAKNGSLICRSARWIKPRIPALIIYGYAFLYFYTGITKLQIITEFIRGNSKIPYLGKYAELIGWGIPYLEILLAVLLIIPVYKIKRTALWVSTPLMGIFALYLTLMVAFVEKKLCNCGGVIESMGWKTHIIFNVVWFIAGIYALRKTKIINN